PGDLVWLVPIFFLGAAGLILGMGEISTRRITFAAADDTNGDDHELHLAEWRRWGMILSWVLLPVISIYAISLRQPIFTDRYVIWIAPAVMMLVALGV